VQHYWGNAAVGIVATLVSIWLVGKLSLYGAPATAPNVTGSVPVTK
jgi:hypothetical protein